MGESERKRRARAMHVSEYINFGLALTYAITCIYFVLHLAAELPCGLPVCCVMLRYVMQYVVSRRTRLSVV